MGLTLAPVRVTTRCKGCGACLLTCPERAIRPGRPATGGDPLHVLGDACTGCGDCLEICPADAIEETSRPLGPDPAKEAPMTTGVHDGSLARTGSR